MKDKLVTALAHGGHIRLWVANTTQLVQEAKLRHNLWPSAAVALGRTLSVAAIMGADLKDDDEKLIISIRSDGVISSIVAEAHNDGSVRGYIEDTKAYAIDPKTDALIVGPLLGKGTLNVTRKSGLKVDYDSSVELQSGEIGEDFANYYLLSEQIPSAVSVGVRMDEDGNVEAAGAIIIEVMPGADDMDIMIIEDVVNHLKPISTIIDEGMEPEEIALSLFQDVEILKTQDLMFYCGCNRGQMRTTLSMLSIEDLRKLRDEDQGCEMVCHYCNQRYRFDEQELSQIIERKLS